MKKYVDYTPEEFATDEYFIQWIKSADVATETFWQDWVETHPYKRGDIESGRQIVLLAIQVTDFTISNIELRDLKTSIFSKIEKPEKPQVIIPMYRKWSSIAASITIAAGLAYSWFYYNSNKQIIATSEKQVDVVSYDKSIEERNFSQVSKLINLPDKSSVVLKPGSKLTYSLQFNDKIREVYLTGEAFFEVTKNPEKPFYVHANEITTKVLGTSFNIKAYLTDQPVSVKVKTGRVAIYKKDDVRDINAKQNNELTGFIITKGQSAVFNKGQLKLIEPQDDAKESVNDIMRHLSFDFEDASIKDVFSRIEQAYNVKIQYDNKHLGDCSITASLTDEPFSEKLRLVCKAVRADYIIENGQVFVTGGNCR
ncbi:FecR family protein [Dyadobacter sp. CY347]|uniref:FecR family protein n=1 Tax=Dyadobacter sp. CY347 TaxID=2909336 RepID=UPI001F1A7333|nr:FecR family protein [Dyadobacter sp. CY347]MCF2491606.1 FecR family protein [Dyadobacter sp. CY347]